MEIYSPTLFIEINNSEYIFAVGDESEQENFKKSKILNNKTDHQNGLDKKDEEIKIVNETEKYNNAETKADVK